MSRLRNKKLRKKSELISKLYSLNTLHDLKNQHTISRETEFDMLQQHCLKPKKLNKTGTLINTVIRRKMPVIIKTAV